MPASAEKGILSGLTFMLIGASLLGLQCFWSVRAGIWLSFSVVDALQMLGPDPMSNGAAAFGAWLDSPQSWIRLHMLLDWISLPVVFLTFGLMAVSSSKV
ncbi:hypothetical protein [Mesorhizobium sp. 1B3]|uniref:hypothetical protein n=1 Tax=Mesorhizobium sp. 1B3 TaxID=3243599 RepID=UPI003D99B6E5